MPAPEVVLGAAIVVALDLYFLFGGADFGGGVWDLLARGSRRDAQRALVEHAIGPVWEANHVWLILVVVVTFTAFPPAFAAFSIVFHVPLTLFLLGIVLRGSSFAFRSFDVGAARTRFGLAFSIASVVSPVLLGMIVGAAASGRAGVRISGNAVTATGTYHAWLSPFPVATGLFSLALCAYLAATYLTCEATSAGHAGLAEDFRRRALAAAGAVAGLGVVTLGLSVDGAPRIAGALLRRPGSAAAAAPWALAVEVAALVAAGLGVAALARRRFSLARLFAAAQVALILTGWAVAQYPFLLVPDLTLVSASANPRTQRLLLYALAAGLPVLGPSLYLLFRVFKASPASSGAASHDVA